MVSYFPDPKQHPGYALYAALSDDAKIALLDARDAYKAARTDTLQQLNTRMQKWFDLLQQREGKSYSAEERMDIINTEFGDEHKASARKLDEDFNHSVHEALRPLGVSAQDATDITAYLKVDLLVTTLTDRVEQMRERGGEEVDVTLRRLDDMHHNTTEARLTRGEGTEEAQSVLKRIMEKRANKQGKDSGDKGRG